MNIEEATLAWVDKNILSTTFIGDDSENLGLYKWFSEEDVYDYMQL
jgi:hypothetical protein